MKYKIRISHLIVGAEHTIMRKMVISKIAIKGKRKEKQIG